jgi:hypothetical protein
LEGHYLCKNNSAEKKQHITKENLEKGKKSTKKAE